MGRIWKCIMIRCVFWGRWFLIIYIKILYLKDTKMGFVENFKKPAKFHPLAELRSWQHQKKKHKKFQLEYWDITFHSLWNEYQVYFLGIKATSA